MSETPETSLQIIQNGQGRFCLDLERIIEARNAEVLGAVINLRKQRAELERERDEARRDLAAANKGAETNAKVNQILCKKLFLLIRRLKRREKEYLNASLGELCEDLFSRNRYEGESIGTRWAREDLELILSKLKIKEEA